MNGPSSAISGSVVRDVHLCERKVALDMHGRREDRDPTSAFVEMLWREGLSHEANVLAAVSGDGVLDLRDAPRNDAAELTMTAVRNRSPVILGALLEHEDMVGMPDLLRLTPSGYVAEDVKSGAAVDGPRGTYRIEYLLQVAHYAHMLAKLGIGTGGTAGIIDRSGRGVAYDLSLPLGREGITGRDLHLMKLDHARAIRATPASTRGALSARCGMCAWRTLCRRELDLSDDLTLLAGLGRSVRSSIETIAPTMTALAGLDTAAAATVPGVGQARLARFVERARLYVDPEAGPKAKPNLGLVRAPHAIDFDIEADPLRGIVYLHGFWHVRDGAPGTFVHFFAETADEAGEREAFRQAISHFRANRDAHWFHYSAYERTAYRALQRRHPHVCDADEIEQIFDPVRCSDLYAAVASDTDWPLSSYGIKSIAKACGFSWEDTDPGGAQSIQWYDRYVATGDRALRDRIVAYNRDDVRASEVVRAALAELEDTGAVAGFKRPPRARR